MFSVPSFRERLTSEAEFPRRPEPVEKVVVGQAVVQNGLKTPHIRAPNTAEQGAQPSRRRTEERAQGFFNTLTSLVPLPPCAWLPVSARVGSYTASFSASKLRPLLTAHHGAVRILDP